MPPPSPVCQRAYVSNLLLYSTASPAVRQARSTSFNTESAASKESRDAPRTRRPRPKRLGQGPEGTDVTSVRRLHAAQYMRAARPCQAPAKKTPVFSRTPPRRAESGPAQHPDPGAAGPSRRPGRPFRLLVNERHCIRSPPLAPVNRRNPAARRANDAPPRPFAGQARPFRPPWRARARPCRFPPDGAALRARVAPFDGAGPNIRDSLIVSTVIPVLWRHGRPVTLCTLPG